MLELKPLFSNQKKKKIFKNERKLAKIHGESFLFCTNETCHSKVKVTKEELERVFLCTTCNQGYLKK